MTIEYDEKGKRFTDIVTKRPVYATVQTTKQLLRGNIHVRRDQRIKDELELDDKFIAITDVSILGEDGQVLYQAPFLAIEPGAILFAQKVAQFVCDLLNIEFNFNYRTILIGNACNSYLLESVPDQIIDPKTFGIENVIMRMDYIFDENILAQQLQRCPCTIVTNRPINPRIIQQFKSAIHDIVYIIEEHNDPNFVEMLM